MVAIDNSLLSLLLHPKARPPKDPATNKPVERMADRIERLIEDLESDQERIILPTPALSEFLVLAGNDASSYLDEINARRMIIVRPFDQMAAIELAAIELEDRKAGSKRGGVDAPWTKVKFDRQIVVIAKTNQAKRIYSDDRHVRAFATKVGIETVSSWELPLPAAKQTNMFDEEEINEGSEQPESNKLEADPTHPPTVQGSDSGRAQGEAPGEAKGEGPS